MVAVVATGAAAAVAAAYVGTALALVHSLVVSQVFFLHDAGLVVRVVVVLDLLLALDLAQLLDLGAVAIAVLDLAVADHSHVLHQHS